MKKDNILERKDATVKVLGVCGKIIFPSMENDHKASAGQMFTEEELEKDGWKVKRETGEPREWWFNIYSQSNYSLPHNSKDKADEYAESGRLECIHVREILE